MSRPSSGDFSLNQPPSPFHTPPAGLQPTSLAVPMNYAGQPLPPSPPVRASGPTPLGLLYALKRRWVMAGVIGVVTAGVAAVAAALALPAGKHEARAHVQILFPPNDGITRTSVDPESYRQTQMFILKTRDLITRTLADPSVASLEMVRNSDDPVKMIEDGLRVNIEPGREIITVSLTGDNPEDMRVILDQLVRRYIDDAVVLERKTRDDRMRRLQRQAEEFKAEIQSKEKAIQLMAESHLTTGKESTAAEELTKQLAQLDADVFQSRKAIMELDARMSLLRGKIESKKFDFSPAQVNTMVDGDPRVLKLLQERAFKEELLATEKTRVSEQYPTPPIVVRLTKELEQLDKDVKTIRDKIRPEVEVYLKRATEQQLQDNLKDLEDQRASAVKLLEFREGWKRSLEEKVRTRVKGALNVDSLNKELDPLRATHARLLEQINAVRVEKDLEPRVSIRQNAYVTLNKNLKQKIMVAAGAGVVALLGVLVLVGYLEWRTRRIDGVDQVVSELGMRVIGTVPAFPNKSNLMAAETAGGANWRFALNESINSTRTMLLHAARSSSMQVVMVTSATQGEGKTSLASQLATSMATAGMRTLIVDCDLRNPSIHKLFDLGLSVGVSEVLCQEADVSEAVQPTAIPSLWAIPAGQCSNRVINALAQGHPLETLFNRLRGQFDFVIVDSCPVLPVADALLIGQHVDGVLFSIMQDVSQLPKVLVASEKLAQLNIRLVGAVVNGIRQNTYSYGYNYVKQLPA
jgi:capsular exopolysaccharide synthesis family protein